MGCCLQAEEPTEPSFCFVPESIPRDITGLRSTLDPASVLCYDTAHDVTESYRAKSVTEKLSFNCGQVNKKNSFLSQSKVNKITKPCIPEFMLTCLCSWPTACGKITEPVGFYCLSTATASVSPLAKQRRWTSRCCGDHHAT